MEQRGLNQAQLAETVGVSRAAMTKWLKGQDLPRPDKLLKTGMAVGLGFRDLVTEEPDPMLPVVAFRKKGRHKTKTEHMDRARHTGTLLRQLVQYLPFSTLERPPSLQAPQAEYGYVQRVAQTIRDKIGVAQDAPFNIGI